MLETLSPEQMTRTSSTTKSAIKDVLAHIYEWEQMCIGWYKTGLDGKMPALPAEGYNWAKLPALNQMIHEKHREKGPEEILKLFHESYQAILKMVEGLSEDELFTIGKYAWTNNNALAAYFIGATSSHYVWAKKEIKTCLKDQAN